MPATLFYVTWPDGEEERCYSPSTVIRQYLKQGDRYSVAEFEELCHAGLNEASERVKQKFGYYCSSAMDQLRAIQARSLQFGGQDGAVVTVTRIVVQ